MHLSRRELLRLGGFAVAGTALAPSRTPAQTPKRGGTLTIRGWDPPFFDPMLTTAYRVHYPGEQKNQSHVDDPVVTDFLVRQRRTLDTAKRREIIGELQRYLAKQQYYVQLPSAIYVAVWDGALKNYGPNLGYDYGGRLMGAWLDR